VEQGITAMPMPPKKETADGEQQMPSID